ncbi:MAG: PDR/VanB family oxidoreductase [Nocardioidaceae bacterium]|nr:PDR/VanB family oxidoreductase [Nocardioidaceae bacterium]
MVADNRPVWQPAEVVESRMVTDQVRRVTLRRPGTRRAQPGSHVDVRVDLGARTDVRSYSVVEASADGSQVTVSVMLAPRSRGGSRFMHGLREGDVVECTQPLQNFDLRLGAPRHLLVAGGIGVTALAAMAETLRTTGRDYTLVYVGRSRAAMAYLDELEQAHGDRLRVHVDDQGHPLDVAALVDEVAGSSTARATELYVCGPIRLMDAVRRAWAGAGLPVHNLRFETFGNSGWFDAEDFVVRVPRLGLETTVGADTTILEALTEAGAEMMFDCRKGECGLCQVDVRDVDGSLDHRDVFFSARQHEAGDQLCTCVSRVACGDGRTGVLTLDLP